MVQIVEGIYNPKKLPRHLNFLQHLKKSKEMNDIESFSF